MKTIDILKLALKNFLRRKTRSILTILGVIIGTMAVVIMLSIGEGLNVGYEKQVSQWGSLTQIDVNQSWDKKGLFLDDNAVEYFKGLPNVSAVMGKLSGSVILINGKELANTEIIAVDAEVMKNFDFTLSDGRLLESTDRGKIVMGYNIPFNFYNPKKQGEWKNPFDEKGKPNPLPFNPIKSKLKLTFDWSYGQPGPKSTSKKPKLYNVECVGVFAPGYSSSAYSVYMDFVTFNKWQKEFNKSQAGNSNPGGDISLPKTPEQQNANKNKFTSISIKVNSIKNVEKTLNTIKEQGYQAWSSIESLKQMQKQAGFIQLILGGIGAIAFIVAALGITNTMIMSTYERTREIGIMKVIGCKLSNIRLLFLFESAIIGLLGGTLGIGFSFFISMLLNKVTGISQALGMGMMNGTEAYAVSIIPTWLIFSSIGFTTFIGIVSGLYPASRAVRISALDAIKNEV